EIDLGQEIFLKAIKHNPTLLTGAPSRFIETVLDSCIADESAEHDKLIGQVLNHLPPSQAQLSNEYDGAVARGFFMKGVRAIIWGRREVGLNYLKDAFQKDLHLDDQMFSSITAQLQNYEHEFGEDATLQVLDRLSDSLNKIGRHSEARTVKGSYFFNRAFQSYHKQEYHKVPNEIGQAFTHHPRYITNRGAFSILIRSITRSMDKR
ncbi:MAG: hypothetical protein WAV05_18660, partial [Anaerolineales bacterium]